MSLQEIPESMQEGESDCQRWFFETQRKAWEQEQQTEAEATEQPSD